MLISSQEVICSYDRYDRCDRCNAAAWMRALIPGATELLFCRYHALQHEARLREIGAQLSPEP